MTRALAIARSPWTVLPLAVLTALAIETLVSGPTDTRTDTLGWVDPLARALAAVPVTVVLCLLAVTVMHYLAAAVAARAAAGVPLPVGPTIGAQLVAAAANRITPAGLGGATVLGRYLQRRGRLDVTRAAAAVSSLVVLGGLADLVAFVLLIGVGVALGSAGLGSAAPSLLGRATTLLPSLGGWWLVVVGAAGLVASLAVFLARHRLADHLRRARRAAADFRSGVTVLLRRPGRVVLLMAGSATTTVVLAMGFAASAILPPGGLPVADFGALMAGYMLAAAAGNAIPTPGGIGSADAAFAAVLLAAGMSAAPAFAVVLVFRLVTFWLPAAVGLVVAPALRRAGDL
ncbi:MAG: lysylphosphatidylglycerol synthase transmembrane domain-containing protein [Jatrophihabitans sp.]|uniref:lysylphosphatidylglycerol synthase transmembrane domain-containing protein n=1 Tax=Jatrophihabitans sp. TaxID=1932789 RepID=UPI003F7F6306